MNLSNIRKKKTHSAQLIFSKIENYWARQIHIQINKSLAMTRAKMKINEKGKLTLVIFCVLISALVAQFHMQNAEKMSLET